MSFSCHFLSWFVVAGCVGTGASSNCSCDGEQLSKDGGPLNRLRPETGKNNDDITFIYAVIVIRLLD